MLISDQVDTVPMSSKLTQTVKRKESLKERQISFKDWYIKIYAIYGEANPRLLDSLEIAKDRIV